VPQPATLPRAPSFLNNCTKFNDNNVPLREVISFRERKIEERKEKKIINKVKKGESGKKWSR
jgi:hypothetical protein